MAISSIDYEKCTGCGECVNACEQDVLRMDEETGKPIIVYLDDCIICNRCENDCPVNAIQFVPGINIPITSFYGY